MKCWSRARRSDEADHPRRSRDGVFVKIKEGVPIVALIVSLAAVGGAGFEAKAATATAGAAISGIFSTSSARALFGSRRMN